jgi:phosphoribosyl 1,2-cyclic phosphodiesterase
LLIRHRVDSAEDGVVATVLIDVGKTFRECAQRWLPLFAPSGIDAVILTHEHADAIMGIDDLRGVQKSRPLPIFLSNQCHDRIVNVYPYLQPASNLDSRLFVASIDWRLLEGLTLDTPTGCHFTPVPGLEVEAFAVEHGSRFMSLGFALGPDHAKFVYISDVSAVPGPTLKRLKAFQVDTLVVDCVDPGPATYPTHFNLPQSLEFARALSPKRVLLVGMTHKFEHYRSNQDLALLLSEGLDVQLAYDGQCVELAPF